MVALEPDVDLFEEILVPLLPTPEEKDINSRHDPFLAQQWKRPPNVKNEEVEKKRAPKRKCK